MGMIGFLLVLHSHSRTRADMDRRRLALTSLIIRLFRPAHLLHLTHLLQLAHPARPSHLPQAQARVSSSPKVLLAPKQKGRG
jgi:hypothetical protein